MVKNKRQITGKDRGLADGRGSGVPSTQGRNSNGGVVLQWPDNPVAVGRWKSDPSSGGMRVPAGAAARALKSSSQMGKGVHWQPRRWTWVKNCPSYGSVWTMSRDRAADSKRWYRNRLYLTAQILNSAILGTILCGGAKIVTLGLPGKAHFWLSALHWWHRKSSVNLHPVGSTHGGSMWLPDLRASSPRTPQMPYQVLFFCTGAQVESWK